MTFLAGVVFVLLLGTNLELSNAMSLKRHATENCKDQMASCRPQEEPTLSWFGPLFDTDGSLNINCSAVGNQNTCEENLDDTCRDESGWLELRVKITIEQHACNQSEVFTSGRQCWTNIEKNHSLRDCTFCNFAQCVEQTLPGVPECSARHVRFFSKMTNAEMRHFQRIDDYQC